MNKKLQRMIGLYVMLVCMIFGNVAGVKITNAASTTKVSFSVRQQTKENTMIVTVDTSDCEAEIAKVLYIKAVLDVDSRNWDRKAKDITNELSFSTTIEGDYSVYVEDVNGNKAVRNITVSKELKAVWISYLEFNDRLKDSTGNVGFTEKRFTSMINEMFDNVASLGMNAVIVHVRPFGDAMYPSEYFPWSKYISGTQGKNPGFDPLKIMVDAAHDRGLQFHAWLNPYRITTGSTDVNALAKTNPARRWLNDSKTSNDRNVLSFGGNLYYNPAMSQVQSLIVNGIKEIVTNYDVDGIHFDDYFYPSLGTNYKKNFDYVEYNTYVTKCKKEKTDYMSIADWRRENVNRMIRKVYMAVKELDETVEFGISPGGFYDALLSDSGHYVDFPTWMSTEGYVDYVAPQIYWSFDHSTYPFDKTLKKWASYLKTDSVKLYVGIATYKAGSSLEPQWKNNTNILKDMIEYSRNTNKVSGFMFFRYDFFYKSATKKSVDNMLKIL